MIPTIQDEIDSTLKDLNDMRARPEAFVSRFNTILYGFRGFSSHTEKLSKFLEDFIDKLPSMKKLQEVKLTQDISLVADALFKEYEERKKTPSLLTQIDLEFIAKPFIMNFEKISVLFDEQKAGKPLLNKLILKFDEVKQEYGEKSSNHQKIFDPQLQYCGICAKRQKDKTVYVIVLVDKYEKTKKIDPKLISPEEMKDYREIFDLFDEDKDGLLIPQDFNQLLEGIGIAKKNPSLLKFGKYFNDPRFKRGVDFDGFLEAIVSFGTFEDDEAIRRIFELYVDDFDQYTITLSGMKRIVKELNSPELLDSIHEMFKYAINKEIDLSFKEFKDYILRSIKEGKIRLSLKK